MIHLKRSLLAILMLVLIRVAELILNRLSPVTFLFHTNLLLVIRFIVISWWFIGGLLLIRNRNNPLRRYLVVWLIIAMVMFDGLLHYVLINPKYIPSFAKPTFVSYYTSFERNVIQYENGSGYDSSFFYAFKPNTSFIFSNIEFDNRFNINSCGLRDDEASLHAPEIICLGDSYTLGWGVEQHETFPEVLQQMTHKKILNTGVSSYGTAREIKRFSFCDTSALRYIIIQHCRNDADENLAFLKNNDSLRISDERNYSAAKRNYQWGKVYFPGKYSAIMLRSFIRTQFGDVFKSTSRPGYLSENPSASAINFVKVLDKMKFNENRIKLLVIDINRYDELNNRFITSVDSLLHTSRYKRLQNCTIPIDMSAVLSTDDFYIMDAHLKPVGQRKIAKKLATFIN